jgi:putative peptidoglycan lipid II flippase
MGLLRSTAVTGGMTLVSRVSGFLRDVVFAYVFGAGPATDAFFVAFKIPNFLRRLFAEGAFAQAFVPVLSEYKTQRDKEAVRDLVRHVSGTLAVLLFILTVLAVVAAPILVMVFAPGFVRDPAKFDLTAEMLRLTFPYLMFIALTALAGSVLNTFGRFAIPAVTPVLLNLCLIAAALWLAPQMDQPIMALAWGVFLAGVVQLAFQFPALAREGLLLRPRWGWRHAGVRRVIKLMIPALFGSSVMQINLLFDTLIASFLVSGSVTWLFYADRMVEFPLGVFGIALATVILPSLSHKHASNDAQAFSRTLDWALRWVLVLGTPAAIALVILAGPILSTLFQHGQFGPEDVEMAALALMAYGFGLLGFILVKVLAPGFYARQDTRTPVRVGLIAMAVNIGGNILFVVPWALSGLSGPHAGLALATTVSSFVNAMLLFRGLKRAGVYRARSGWSRLASQVVIANAVLAALLVWQAGELTGWVEASVVDRATRLGVCIVSGAAAYFLSLWVTGLRLTALHRPGQI